jgi:hypothetical protein
MFTDGIADDAMDRVSMAPKQADQLFGHSLLFGHRVRLHDLAELISEPALEAIVRELRPEVGDGSNR